MSQQMRTWTVILLGCIASFGVAACERSDDEGTDQDKQLGIEEPELAPAACGVDLGTFLDDCSSNCECPIGLACVEGSCTLDFGPFPECYCSSHCDCGEVCLDNTCVVQGGNPGYWEDPR